jgi:hypothetical protein
VSAEQNVDPELRIALDRLSEGQTADVLVYPSGDSADLVAHLSLRRDRGDLDFAVLELAGCISLRADRTTIHDIAARDDVARVAINPTFTTNAS